MDRAMGRAIACWSSLCSCIYSAAGVMGVYFFLGFLGLEFMGIKLNVFLKKVLWPLIELIKD